jgi:hypothetical protein
MYLLAASSIIEALDYYAAWSLSGAAASKIGLIRRNVQTPPQGLHVDKDTLKILSMGKSRPKKKKKKKGLGKSQMAHSQDHER